MNRRSNVNNNADAHEEAALWESVLTDLKKLPEIRSQGGKCALQVNALQEELLLEVEGHTDLEDVVQKLKSAYEEGLQIAEREQKALNHSQENLGILIALRHASEIGGTGSDNKRKKRKVDDIVAAESPSSSRNKKARSASVSIDIPLPGSQVAFRLPKARNAEYEYIQCNVVRVVGEGSKARYEIQDPEPEENSNAGQVYRTTLANLIPIPADSAGLPPYPNGAQVLARYPETTTFYRAEVIGTKRDGTCRLRFEGEEEVGKETEVERRLVLDANK